MFIKFGFLGTSAQDAQYFQTDFLFLGTPYSYNLCSVDSAELTPSNTKSSFKSYSSHLINQEFKEK